MEHLACFLIFLVFTHCWMLGYLDWLDKLKMTELCGMKIKVNKMVFSQRLARLIWCTCSFKPLSREKLNSYENSQPNNETCNTTRWMLISCFGADQKYRWVPFNLAFTSRFSRIWSKKYFDGRLYLLSAVLTGLLKPVFSTVCNGNKSFARWYVMEIPISCYCWESDV